jgi:hypothetical protein
MATGDHCQSLHSLLIRWALNLDLMMIDTHERQFGQAKVGSVLAASQSSADRRFRISLFLSTITWFTRSVEKRGCRVVGIESWYKSITYLRVLLGNPDKWCTESLASTWPHHRRSTCTRKGKQI